MAENRIIPSKIDDRHWVWAKKSEDEGYESSNDPYGGKWMAFIRRINLDGDGLTLLDRRWFQIEEGVNSGQLYHAKASTALLTPLCTQDDKHTVIICYTKDFRDKEDVRETAVTIRKIFGRRFKNKLQYKTNLATVARHYHRLNVKDVCLYKHLSNYSFWEKVDGEWKLVEDPQGLTK